MSAAILERLESAGLSITLVEDGLIGVSPRARLTEELRALIRSQRDAILAALKPAELPEPPTDPASWRELDRAYQLHHFGCKTCIAAGQGYGLRCGTGMALWTRYEAST